MINRLLYCRIRLPGVYAAA